MEKINKKTSVAFGKKIYLLGIDNDNRLVWIEAPKWDCGWYWGFGYIERYTNNKNPSKAKDIESHSHFQGEIVGQQEFYNHEKQVFQKGEYIHHLNENPNFKASVLTDGESWLLSELMSSFYILQKTAEFFKDGKSNLTDNPLKESFKRQDWRKEINEKMLPLLFKKIDELLSPKGAK